MRGLGIFILIAGVLGLLGAMSMDVSVASGLGRVNNLGLMSQRQNFTTIGGIAIIAGLLMVIFGGKGKVSGPADQVVDSRPCPFCAEPIKAAAIKCKHCGSDVESAQYSTAEVPVSPNAKGGWTVRYDCGSDSEMDSVKNRIAEMPGVILKDDGMTVVTGFFQDKEGAKAFRNRYSMKNGTKGDLYFQPSPLF